jgi:hypothetical protein
MNISRTTVRKDIAGGHQVQMICYEKRSILPEAGKRMQKLAQGKPPGGVREGGLASQLT